MSKYIEIMADTNDGDYITKRTEVTDEVLDQILPILKKIKNKHYNWCTTEYISDDDKDPQEMYEGIITEDDIEWINDEFVPYGEYGIHTINYIKLLVIEEEQTILKV